MKKKQYIFISVNGNRTYKNSLSLKEMQKFVGGYIEKVGNIYCNEDGISLNLKRNNIYPEFYGNIIIEQ